MIPFVSELGSPLTWGTVLWLVADLMAVATIPSVLLHRKGRPLAALAWLFAIMGVPILGVAAWWSIGRNRLRRIRRRWAYARDRMDRQFADLTRRFPIAPLRGRTPMALSGRLPDEELGQIFSVTDGNQVEILIDGTDAYPAMEAAIRAAKRHIHVLFYIWEADETGQHFRDLLAEKARAGVEVRVLIDSVGGSAVRGTFMAPLRAAGATVAFFLPSAFANRQLTINFRNHRKIIVIDGETGFIGGMNIGDAYRRAWHDIAVRLDGPVVEQLQEVFADDWFFTTAEPLADPAYFGHAHRQSAGSLRHPNRCHLAHCHVMASGPDTRQNATHDAIFIGMTSARQRLWVTTPYFIPDTAIQVALRTASYRGVDVRLLLPRRNDVPLVQMAARSYYSDLLSAGIRIFEYDAAILHSKAMIIDHDTSVLGSANLDIRSLQLNFEVNVVITSGTVNASLAKLFAADLTHSVEIRPEDLQTGLKGELLEALAHLLSPLL
jgi:cardiolipin synthase